MPEEVNGNPPKLLGTITDNKNSSNKAVYEIAMGYDATPDNVNFNIEDNTLYYLGADTRDFEIAGVKKSFTITIVRYNNEADAGAKQSPQIFEYIVNLKNLNDTAPVLEGYLADGETEIGYIAAGKVGTNLFEMALKVDADGDTITIDFTHVTQVSVTIDPQPAGATSTSGTLTGFTITSGILGYAQIPLALNGDETFRLDDDAADFAIWDSYEPVVTYISTLSGAPSSSHDLYKVAAVTLTAKQGIVVEEGAMGTIADFDSTDADNLETTLAYSLSDSTADNTGDSTLFDITTDGELSFKTAPSHTSGGGADNIYDITITVSDGTNTTTYDLRVVVKEVSE